MEIKVLRLDISIVMLFIFNGIAFADDTLDIQCCKSRLSVDAGVSVTSYKNNVYKHSPSLGYEIGIDYNFMLLKNKIYVNTGLSFLSNGYRLKTHNEIYDFSCHAQVHYFDVSAAPAYKIPINIQSYICISTGFWGDVGVKSKKYNCYYNRKTDISREWKTDFFKDYDHFRFNYGLLFCAEYYYKVYGAGFCYNYGLMNLSYRDEEILKSRSIRIHLKCYLF